MGKTGKFLLNNVLVIALAFVPPIIIWFFLQREETNLTVTLTTDIPVVSVEEELAQEIEILYRSTPISSLHVLEFLVQNTGNQPIEKRDFESPLTFVLSGSILSKPLITRVNPPSLRPKIDRVNQDSIVVSPLLLNENDLFGFRVYLADRANLSTPVEVFARIANVKEIEFNSADASRTSSQTTFLFGILSTIIGAVSAFSVSILFRRVKRLTISFPAGLALELSRKLESEPETVTHAQEIARQLQISHHDHKSNILLLRIKIESLLKEIAHVSDIPQKETRGGILRPARALVRRGIIPGEIGAAVSDVSPAMNRELHESDSYLSQDEFEVLQQLSLNIIARLDTIKREITDKLLMAEPGDVR